MISSPCFRPSGSFLCFGVSITHGRILSAWTKVTVLAPFTGPLPKRRDTNGLIFATIGPLLLCAFALKFLFSCEDGLSSLGYFRHGFLGTGQVCTFLASEMMCRLRRPPQSFTTLLAISQPRRQCATCSEVLWNTGDCEKKMSTRTVLVPYRYKGPAFSDRTHQSGLPARGPWRLVGHKVACAIAKCRPLVPQ